MILIAIPRRLLRGRELERVRGLRWPGSLASHHTVRGRERLRTWLWKTNTGAKNIAKTTTNTTKPLKNAMDGLKQGSPPAKPSFELTVTLLAAIF